MKYNLWAHKGAIFWQKIRVDMVDIFKNIKKRDKLQEMIK